MVNSAETEHKQAESAAIVQVLIDKSFTITVISHSTAPSGVTFWLLSYVSTEKWTVFNLGCLNCRKVCCHKICRDITLARVCWSVITHMALSANRQKSWGGSNMIYCSLTQLMCLKECLVILLILLVSHKFIFSGAVSATLPLISHCPPNHFFLSCNFPHVRYI